MNTPPRDTVSEIQALVHQFKMQLNELEQENEGLRKKLSQEIKARREIEEQLATVNETIREGMAKE